MGKFICPDYCLDNYASPPADMPTLPNYAQLGDELEVVQGDDGHGWETRGVCSHSPGSQTYGEATKSYQRAGTGGGVYKSARDFEWIDGGGVRVKSTFQHAVGPFGNLTLPVNVAHWCRQWGGVHYAVGFYHPPALVYPEFSPTYIPFHLIIPIYSETKVWDLVNPKNLGQELHFKFDISVAFDMDGLDKKKDKVKIAGANAALFSLRYAYTGNRTPFVPNTGLVRLASFTKWRKVNHSSLNIELVLFLQPTILFPGTAKEVPHDDLFFEKPRLIININNFKLAYR